MFFWSEAHAKAHRQKLGGEVGIYLTLPQSIYVTEITQRALFAF